MLSILCIWSISSNAIIIQPQNTPTARIVASVTLLTGLALACRVIKVLLVGKKPCIMRLVSLMSPVSLSWRMVWTMLQRYLISLRGKLFYLIIIWSKPCQIQTLCSQSTATERSGQLVFTWNIILKSSAVLL